MILAEKIEFSDRPPVIVGQHFSGREVTRIEIFHDEYEDHSEMTAQWYHNGIQIGKCWNIPIVITNKVNA
jgi:hypothetical protein